MVFGNMSAKQASALLPAAIRGLASGVIVFLLLILVDQFSVRMGLTGMQRFADDLLGGAIVGAISFLDERRRRRYLASRIEVINQMNHHVRNAIQAIKFAHETDHAIRIIDDAIARIEWALREILPGEASGSLRGETSREGHHD